MSYNTTLFRRLRSRIITKIGILVVIEIIIILSSFVILAYFESQGTYLGNSINIAGKNRFLTANVQLATVEFQSGSSNVGNLSKAIDTLESNIRALKDGGSYLGLELRPLPPQFLNYWNVINQNWDDYKKSIATTTKELKTKALALIGSSDTLVTKLGEFAKINSQNLMLLQILLGILNIMILAVLSYLIVRMLEPISALTKATAEVRRGNLDVTVAHAGGDELSDLSQSFNSMVESIKNYRRNQNELTDTARKNKRGA